MFPYKLPILGCLHFRNPFLPGAVPASAAQVRAKRRCRRGQEALCGNGGGGVRGAAELSKVSGAPQNGWCTMIFFFDLGYQGIPISGNHHMEVSKVMAVLPDNPVVMDDHDVLYWNKHGDKLWGLGDTNSSETGDGWVSPILPPHGIPRFGLPVGYRFIVYGIDHSTEVLSHLDYFGFLMNMGYRWR